MIGKIPFLFVEIQAIRADYQRLFTILRVCRPIGPSYINILYKSFIYHPSGFVKGFP